MYMFCDVNWGAMRHLQYCLPGVTQVYNPAWTLKSNLNMYPRKWKPLE